jgi:glutamate/tyrosine decarboxylase-like PLP-dependent enzyme
MGSKEITEARAMLREVLGSFEPVAIPEQGLSADEALAELSRRKGIDPDFHSPKLLALMYPTGREDHERLLIGAHELYLWGNALNFPKFPQILQLEHEVISMVGGLLHMPAEGGGTVTSGGTESILMSMLVNRERAYARGIERPQIVAPYSAHAAYAKAAKYFGMEYLTYPYGEDFRADLSEAAKLLSDRTAVLIASAMSFSHSVIDPITELGAMAADRGIGCHVDACVGGFVLPFLERLGYDVAPWDFRVPGVTEISIDLHKYGYSTKGASIIVHRDSDWIEHQFFLFDGWSAALYGTPAMPGARPATGIATGWAVLKHLGIDGYTQLTREIMEVTDIVRRGVESIPELHIVGDPVGPMFAIGSEEIDVNRVGDVLVERGWHFDTNTDPPSLHVMFSPAHLGIADELVADLREAASAVSTAGAG